MPWAAVASPPNAAVGGTRSIAPGFSRVNDAPHESSPRSGRQTHVHKYFSSGEILWFDHADVPVAHGTSAACRPLHGLNSICAVSTRLKPSAMDLVPPTAAESLQAPVRGAATHGVERSV